MKFFSNLSLFMGFLCMVLAYGCDKCPSELQIEPMSILPSGLDTITKHFEKNALVFIDANDAEVAFALEESFEGFEKNYIDSEATCDNGTRFRPYKMRERRRRTYVSPENDSIVISLFSHTFTLVSQEARIDNSPEPIIGRGVFNVRLAFSGCEPFEGGRFTENSDGNSQIMYTVFPFQKHGQYYDDLFNIRTERWIHDMNFSLSQGLIAFDFCGRDYVQVVD